MVDDETTETEARVPPIDRLVEWAVSAWDFVREPWPPRRWVVASAFVAGWCLSTMLVMAVVGLAGHAVLQWVFFVLNAWICRREYGKMRAEATRYQQFVDDVIEATRQAEERGGQ